MSLPRNPKTQSEYMNISFYMKCTHFYILIFSHKSGKKDVEYSCFVFYYRGKFNAIKLNVKQLCKTMCLVLRDNMLFPVSLRLTCCVSPSRFLWFPR